jgi:hypothetical protein
MYDLKRLKENTGICRKIFINIWENYNLEFSRRTIWLFDESIVMFFDDDKFNRYIVEIYKNGKIEKRLFSFTEINSSLVNIDEVNILLKPFIIKKENESYVYCIIGDNPDEMLQINKKLKMGGMAWFRNEDYAISSYENRYLNELIRIINYCGNNEINTVKSDTDKKVIDYIVEHSGSSNYKFILGRDFLNNPSLISSWNPLNFENIMISACINGEKISLIDIPEDIYIEKRNCLK